MYKLAKLLFVLIPDRKYKSIPITKINWFNPITYLFVIAAAVHRLYYFITPKK